MKYLLPIRILVIFLKYDTLQFGAEGNEHEVIRKMSFTFCIMIMLIGTLVSQDPTPSKAITKLDVNNVTTSILNGGEFWWDREKASYTVPNNEIDSISALGAGGLWLGGLTENGDLRLAAVSTNIGNSTDYYAGPLDENGDYFENGSLDWDRFFEVNKEEVDTHVADFIDDGIVDIRQDNIYGWPAIGNEHFEELVGFSLPDNQSLAPFFDFDDNGKYDPDYGDYPLVKGDQSIWWVFNDNGQHRSTQANKLSIEVHVMAYALSSNNVNVNNTTYYDFKIINKSSENLKEFYMGLWINFLLGCETNDYIGFSKDLETMYGYNESGADNFPEFFCSRSYGDRNPIVGIKQLNNPTSSFLVMNRFFEGGNIAQSDPELAIEHYNCLNGKWRDGTPITYGGNGYDPTSNDSTQFMYNGDPSEEDDWTMCSFDVSTHDWRTLMNTYIGDLASGESFENSYAVIFIEDVPEECPSLDILTTVIEDVENTTVSSTTTLNMLEKDFNLSSNPAFDHVDIECSSMIKGVQLINLAGQVIKEVTKVNRREYRLSLDAVPSGAYFINIVDIQRRVLSKKLIVLK